MGLSGTERRCRYTISSTKHHIIHQSINQKKMPAFEGFDDIDPNTPEVFETSDIESIPSTPSAPSSPPISSRRDSLSNEAFDTDQSRLIFQHSQVNANLTDFSGRLDKLASYETYVVNETLEEKLERLRRELGEVQDELEKGKTKESEKDLKQVELLKNVFRDVNRNVKDKALLDLGIVQEQSVNLLPAFHAKESEVGNISSSSSSSLDEILKLNERIQNLELTLGQSHPITPSESITSKLNALHGKLQLLTNDKEQLSTISTQIDKINDKFQSSLALRRQGLLNSATATTASGISDESISLEDKHILQLYRTYQNLTPFIDDLPHLLSRLQSLHQIHLRSGNIVEFVDGLENQLGSMEADMNAWEQSLNGIEGKIKELDSLIGGNDKQ